MYYLLYRCFPHPPAFLNGLDRLSKPSNPCCYFLEGVAVRIWIQRPNTIFQLVRLVLSLPLAQQRNSPLLSELFSVFKWFLSPSPCIACMLHSLMCPRWLSWPRVRVLLSMKYLSPNLRKGTIVMNDMRQHGMVK